MEDFNQMCQDIENGMTASDGKADAAVATANTAMQTAAAAAILPYVIGNYVGNGSQTVVELGFRPSAVLIWGYNWVGQTGADSSFWIFTNDQYYKEKVTFTETGFIAKCPDTNPFPSINSQGRGHTYIAFR